MGSSSFAWTTGAGSRVAIACLAASMLIGCGSDTGERDLASPTSGGQSPSGVSSTPSPSEWKRLGEIAYVLPEELPAGWTVRSATERVGLPLSRWQVHTEVLGDADSYLIISANSPNSSTGFADGFPSLEPGVIDDIDPREFLYFLPYFTFQARRSDVPHVDFSSRRGSGRAVLWRANGFELFIAHLSAEPDDPLIERVSDEMRQIDTLDFPIPNSTTSAGFSSIGSAAGPGDPPDYSVSWAPTKLAGVDREAVAEEPYEGPHLSLHVGARGWAQNATAVPGDPFEAPIMRDASDLSISFLLNGSIVRVVGRDVGKEAIRSLATSLRVYSRDEWRALLGERLVVDEPEL